MLLSCFWVYKKKYYYRPALASSLNFEATAVLFFALFFILLIQCSIKIVLCLFIAVEYSNLECFLQLIVWGSVWAVVYINVWLITMLLIITHSGGFRCQDTVLIQGYAVERFLRKLNSFQTNNHNPLFLLSTIIFIICEWVYSGEYFIPDGISISFSFLNSSVERSSSRYKKRYTTNIFVVYLIIGAILFVPRSLWFHNGRTERIRLYASFIYKKDYAKQYPYWSQKHPIIIPDTGLCVGFSSSDYFGDNLFWKYDLIIPNKAGEIVPGNQYLMNFFIRRGHIIPYREIKTVCPSILWQAYSFLCENNK